MDEAIRCRETGEKKKSSLVDGHRLFDLAAYAAFNEEK